MKFLVLFVSLLNFPTLGSEILFKADRNGDCTQDEHDRNFYASCKPIPRQERAVVFAPGRVSQTDLSFVNQVPVNNVIRYSYPCRSAGSDFKAYLQYGGFQHSLSRGQSDRVFSQQVVPNGGKWELHFNDDPHYNFMFVDARCEIRIDQNFAIPSVTALRWYAGQLSQRASVALDLFQNLELAASPPAKYAVVHALPGILQSKIEERQFDLSLLEREKNQLIEAQRTRELTPLEAARLSEVSGGYLETVTAEVQSLRDLKQNVAEGLLPTVDCEGGQCLQAVNEVIPKVQFLFQGAREEIVKLLQFLTSETERLSGEAELVSRDLSELAESLNPYVE